MKNIFFRDINRKVKKYNYLPYDPLTATKEITLSAEDDYIKKQDRYIIQKSITQISPPKRKVLSYFFYEGKKISEIAELDRASSTQVTKNNKVRALKSMRELYFQYI